LLCLNIGTTYAVHYSKILAKGIFTMQAYAVEHNHGIEKQGGKQSEQKE